QHENGEEIKKKALALGASKVYLEDLKKEFVEKYMFQALKADAVYEGRYLMGTALARPLIAEKQVAIAKAENATILAHGATAKGNDQIRFELAYYALMPEAKIYAPWKDPEFFEQFKGRSDLLAYAEKHGIPVSSTKQKPYSIDANCMHISYEGGDLEDPAYYPAVSPFQLTKDIADTPDTEATLAIHFKGGVPIAVENKDDGNVVTGSLALCDYLNDIGGLHGIGRLDIVENRFIGIKSRGLYEAPAATILWASHRDLELLALDKEVMHLKDYFMPLIAQLIYNGFWFSPEMKFLMASIEQSQHEVEGTVYVKLHKGNVLIQGRASPFSRYKRDIASMDEQGAYNPLDVQGFINMTALRLRLEHKKKG
ncbi:MAG TPA: argininosuccinate synthase, partial [Candidatus Bathyarchaeia archaeon]|nr:argininosuccinate synthase [Candidatus Bathyarchaeia archaeon]